MKIKNVKIGMIVKIKKSFDLYSDFNRVGHVVRRLPGMCAEIEIDNGSKVAVPIYQLKKIKNISVYSPLVLEIYKKIYAPLLSEWFDKTTKKYAVNPNKCYSLGDHDHKHNI